VKQLNRCEVIAAARQKHLAGLSHQVRPQQFCGVELYGLTAGVYFQTCANAEPTVRSRAA
jgi:hypothetical protein